MDTLQQAIDDGKAFITTTRAKMERLVEDFADGRLNREQFQALYERYQKQINGVKNLLAETDPTHWQDAIGGEHTIDIRSRLMAKAVGMLIFINHDLRHLDTLGQPVLSPVHIYDILEHIPEQAANGIYEAVTEIPRKGWILVMRGELTTVILLFSREPTFDQRATIRQLLTDFEHANAALLKRPDITTDQLAMPFQVLIRRAGRH